MDITPRARVKRIPSEYTAVSWVRAQVIAQSVRNVRQVGQWQPMSRIMPGNEYLKGVDSVDASRTAPAPPFLVGKT